MREHRWMDYLDHMIEAAKLIEVYLEGLNKSEFMTDKRTHQAKVIEQYPEIPWKNPKGMRNRIAYGYFDIDLEIVWGTAVTAIPQLVKQLPLFVNSSLKAIRYAKRRGEVL